MTVRTTDPITGVSFDDAGDPSLWAPGIRRDGVYSGYELNGTTIPNAKTNKNKMQLQ